MTPVIGGGRETDQSASKEIHGRAGGGGGGEGER